MENTKGPLSFTAVKVILVLFGLTVLASGVALVHFQKVEAVQPATATYQLPGNNQYTLQVEIENLWVGDTTWIYVVENDKVVVFGGVRVSGQVEISSIQQGYAIVVSPRFGAAGHCRLLLPEAEEKPLLECVG